MTYQSMNWTDDTAAAAGVRITMLEPLNAPPSNGSPAQDADGEQAAVPAVEDASLSFEEAQRELEEVVAALETGNVPLEQMIVYVRRGLALYAQCDATLAEAEATLEELLATPEGELTTRRLSMDGDEADEGE